MFKSLQSRALGFLDPLVCYNKYGNDSYRVQSLCGCLLAELGNVECSQLVDYWQNSKHQKLVA